jgi:8-oxo-dGTP pyrophosphatase MutT (NUDIX family)
VVFRRDPAGGAAQVLLLERSGAMRFAGGATVFPGGRIDRADYELAERVRSDLDLDDAAARVAAIRETLEESGLAIGLVGSVTAETAAAARRMLIEQGTLAPVLEAFGWQLALDRLTPFARWLPKHRAPASSIRASTLPIWERVRWTWRSMPRKTRTCSGPARARRCGWPKPAKSR